MRATGGIDLQGQRLINSAPPTGDDDLVTKAYTDSRLSEVVEQFVVVEETNLHPDPSHEHGTIVYNALDGATAVLDNTIFHSGLSSVKVTTVATGQDANLSTPVTAGTYTYSAWLYVPTGTNGANIRLGGADVNALSSADVTVNDVWTQVSVTTDVLVDTNVIMYINVVGSSGTVYVDDVGLVSGVTPVDFSGDTEYDGTNFYRWTGTPGDSSSEKFVYAVQGAEAVISNWSDITALSGFPATFPTSVSEISDRTPLGESLLTAASDTEARAALSLDQVDNTPDLSKPVSTATQSALSLKADTATVSAIDTRLVTVEGNQVDTTALESRVTTAETKITEFDAGGILNVGYLVLGLNDPVPDGTPDETLIVRRTAEPPSVAGYTYNTAWDSNVDPLVLDPATILSGSVIEDGDMLVAAFISNGNDTGLITPPVGWTSLLTGAAGTMVIDIYTHQRQTGETSYSFDVVDNRSFNAMMFWVRGASAATNWVVGDTWSRDGSTAQQYIIVSPAISAPANSLVMSLNFERTTATETDDQIIVDNFAKGFVGEQAGTAISSITACTYTSTVIGTTPTNTVTYPNPQVNNGFGVQIGIPR